MNENYGLTEKEKEIHIQKYNHALFKNMIFFADVVWEINIQIGNIAILEDKTEPENNTTNFVYEAFFQNFLKNRIKKEQHELFEKYLSFENLKNMRQEVSFDIEIKAEKKDEWNQHRIVLTPAFENDELVCIYMSARNIQAEIRRELLEYQSQQQFRDALMSNSYFYYTFDVTGDGLIHDDNVTKNGIHLIQETTGKELPVSFEEFSQKWKEIFEPQFSERQEKNVFTLEYLKQAFAHNERVINMEIKQKVLKNKNKFDYIQMLIILTENPNDKHIHASVVWRDTNAFQKGAIEDNIELTTSNNELKRTLSQEEQFRLASLSGSLLVYNINLTKNLIEDEFYEIVDGKHYPMLQLVGLTAPCSFDEFCKKWSETKIPEESRETFLNLYNRKYMLDAYERGERQLEIEYDTVIGRGIKVTLRNTALLLEDQENGDILAMVSGKDISSQRAEEKRQREALREAYEAANNASAAKSDFLARMSHDIRTPMNAIVGMTAIAGKHLDDKERIKDCLKKINISSEHLLGLINDVLDMSKIESGKFTLQEEGFVLPELMDNIATIVKTQVKQKNHDFSIVINDITHDKVIGDSQHIQQAFMNLISNAIKYTPDNGKISLSVTEKPTNKAQIGCYEFIFEDNGIGMSKEFQEHMFEPFMRAKDNRVEKIQGTGLGMAITKNIVQMMNGTIKVESELNKGSKFVVTIFLKLTDNDEKAPKPTLEIMSENDFTGKRVLVVEDNEINAEIAEEILKMTGLEIEHAQNGQEAVAKISEVPDGYYDIIFMDIQMPVMNGYEATRAIRAIDREYTRQVPILAMSANAFAEDVQASKASGMNEHIAKPLDFKQLEKSLNRWLL